MVRSYLSEIRAIRGEIPPGQVRQAEQIGPLDHRFYTIPYSLDERAAIHSVEQERTELTEKTKDALTETLCSLCFLLFN